MSWLPWLIVIVCVILVLSLWFRDVRRIMLEQKSIVDSSATQLASAQRKAEGWLRSPETEEVLDRSIRIYRQAVDHYNKTLRKPFVYLPATLMHFKIISLNGGI